jgi:hypothetical protein
VTLLNVERQTSHARTSYGPGKSPDWHSDREISLKDEVDLIDPVLAQAGHFIDFWMGAGSWDATPPQRKPAIADSVACTSRRPSQVDFPGLGHLAPVTHPEVMNAEIARFLGEVSPAGVGVEVDAFCLEAMAAGGRDNGAPGLRPHYHANYDAAFVIGPDGHDVEAVCH